MRKKLHIFFVDPMSYNNLSIYDNLLINNIHDVEIEYFASHLFDLGEQYYPVHKIYKYNNKSKLVKLFSYLRSQWKLFNRIKKERPDVVHFQWLKIPFYDVRLIKKIKQLGIKSLFTAHNLVPHGSGRKYEDIYKRIYNELDGIIVHSERTKEELIERFGISSHKIEVIAHGLLKPNEVDSVKVESLILEYKEQMNLNNETVFAALGIINLYKGVDITINAWKNSTLCNNNEAKLIIGGSGNLDELEELQYCANTLVLNRFLSDEEFTALLRITDFLILPYREISQSGVLLTAMEQKKRVIVSDVGGLTEPFKFGKIGYIIESPPTPEELSKSIHGAIKEKDEYPSDEVWKKISEFYSWGAIGEKTKNLYFNLAKKSS